jgi:hypothetical protein
MGLMTSLAKVRLPLLDLHKSLLDAERREYERNSGRLENARFLEVLLQDPQLAWLRPLTALIARLDETLEDEERPAEALDTLVGELRSLLAPDSGGTGFQRRYADVLQRSPDVLVDHGRTRRALGL